jgi:hypothetical protein
VEITSFFGLPAHPLIVHLPVVLIPVTALLAVTAVVWRRHRGVLSLMVAGLAMVGALSAILAAGSGEALQERIGEGDPLIARHAELGESLRLFAVLFAGAAVLFAVQNRPEWLRVGADTSLGRLARSRGAAVATTALVLATAALSVTWTVRTGHSGAEAVWSEEWSQAAASGVVGQADAPAVPDGSVGSIIALPPHAPPGA